MCWRGGVMVYLPKEDHIVYYSSSFKLNTCKTQVFFLLISKYYLLLPNFSQFSLSFISPFHSFNFYQSPIKTEYKVAYLILCCLGYEGNIVMKQNIF